MVDQLIVLENGRKLGDGPPGDVLAREDIVASFIGGSLASKEIMPKEVTQ
jgi:ABC-type branched-subunit amino acid transport system ATPase component